MASGNGNGTDKVYMATLWMTSTTVKFFHEFIYPSACVTFGFYIVFIIIYHLS